MQFDIEDHFGTMMERLCIYIDEADDYVIDILEERIQDNPIAKDIFMFAISHGDIDLRVVRCQNHIQKEFKSTNEYMFCRIIDYILREAYRIQLENVSEFN